MYEYTLDIGTNIYWRKKSENSNSPRDTGHDASTAEAAPRWYERGEQGEARTGNRATIGVARSRLATRKKKKTSKSGITRELSNAHSRPQHTCTYVYNRAKMGNRDQPWFLILERTYYSNCTETEKTKTKNGKILGKAREMPAYRIREHNNTRETNK